ncbi:alpha/beta hydrolase [Actinomadura barringtoniae]|uniref:Alpha/beta hydrolase n=1 Tax=Actinomadura barringtoniae TaxID=1427535 RepID=A0A939PKA2_9ACTN|nr:alpha/beta hydrolase [Actinomadura barringtoniae]MBO2451409.1 alpha/beta hydrolase [Actinomadura barringtoniae]
MKLHVPGGHIAYDLTGPEDGPLVVCVHGMGDNRSTYRLLAPELAAAGYRVATMDTRGYGESSTGWPTHSHEAVAGDLLALINALGRPATVIGHSIGCAAAVSAAATDPDSISALVLIGTFAGGNKPKAWMRAASWLVTRTPALWTTFYKTLFPAAKPADFPEAAAALKSNLAEPGRMSALRAQTAAILAGLDLRYSEVRCPTLLITGTKDPDMADPAAEATRAAEQLSATDATIAMIEESGHYPHLDQPQRTRQAILKALPAMALTAETPAP